MGPNLMSECVSDCCLTKMLQLHVYHGDNKLYVDEMIMMMISAL